MTNISRGYMIISDGDFIHTYSAERPTRLHPPFHRIEEVEVVQALDLRPGDVVYRRNIGLRETCTVLSGWEEAEHLVHIRYVDERKVETGVGVIMTDKGPMVSTLNHWVVREPR